MDVYPKTNIKFLEGQLEPLNCPTKIVYQNRSRWTFVDSEGMVVWNMISIVLVACILEDAS